MTPAGFLASGGEQETRFGHPGRTPGVPLPFAAPTSLLSNPAAGAGEGAVPASASSWRKQGAAAGGGEGLESGAGWPPSGSAPAPLPADPSRPSDPPAPLPVDPSRPSDPPAPALLPSSETVRWPSLLPLSLRNKEHLPAGASGLPSSPSSLPVPIPAPSSSSSRKAVLEKPARERCRSPSLSQSSRGHSMTSSSLDSGNHVRVPPKKRDHGGLFGRGPRDAAWGRGQVEGGAQRGGQRASQNALREEAAAPAEDEAGAGGGADDCPQAGQRLTGATSVGGAAKQGRGRGDYGEERAGLGMAMRPCPTAAIKEGVPQKESRGDANKHAVQTCELMRRQENGMLRQSGAGICSGQLGVEEGSAGQCGGPHEPPPPASAQEVLLSVAVASAARRTEGAHGTLGSSGEGRGGRDGETQGAREGSEDGEVAGTERRRKERPALSGGCATGSLQQQSTETPTVPLAGVTPALLPSPTQGLTICEKGTPTGAEPCSLLSSSLPSPSLIPQFPLGASSTCTLNVKSCTGGGSGCPKSSQPEVSQESIHANGSEDKRAPCTQSSLDAALAADLVGAGGSAADSRANAGEVSAAPSSSKRLNIASVVPSDSLRGDDMPSLRGPLSCAMERSSMALGGAARLSSEGNVTVPNTV
eukprot:TRINITY_DN903_c1_g1_i1.p1 TRINITY_DN903_c1_g1~~TRINITY_DN903_c1_g1_i1.p1  ORF type:complete len:724 (-),score=123.34 TRINITY_DN903_c1_g1_i1:352-2283(-)